MKLIGWIVGSAVALALFYWMIVIGEGTYFGRPVVRLIYRLGAGVYDRVRAPVTRHDHVHLLGPLRVALLGRPQAALLDVATGTGRVPLLLAGEAWYTGAIYGLDLTPAMLERAAAKARAAGLSGRVVWLAGSGDELRRWASGTFGAVTCLEALEYFPRPRRALREMWRVLQPGGTLLISTWTPRHARWLPGKAWTASRMVAFLQQLGCAEWEIRPWQPGTYDLVLAVKPWED